MSKIVRNIPDGLEASYADIKLDTISDLVNLTGTPPEIVWVSGYHTKGDGAFGSHIFEWDPNSTETEISGLIVKVESISTGRYKLKLDGAPNVIMTGAVLDGVTDDKSALISAVNFAISKGVNEVIVPGKIYTTLIDFKQCVFRGINAEIVPGSEIVNVKRYVDVKKNSMVQDYREWHPQYNIDVSPKAIWKVNDNKYYIFVEKSTGDGYIISNMINNVTTYVESLGTTSNDITTFRSAGEINAVDVCVGQTGGYTTTSGSWVSNNLTVDLPSYDSAREYVYEYAGAGAYREYSVEIGDDNEFSVTFLTSSSTSNNIVISVDGTVIDQVDSTHDTVTLYTKKYTGIKKGVRTVKIHNDVASGIAHVVGINFSRLKNVKNPKHIDTIGYYISSAYDHYSPSNSANDYAIFNKDSQTWGGSYHGGETNIVSKFMISGQDTTMNNGDVIVSNSIIVSQSGTIDWSPSGSPSTLDFTKVHSFHIGGYVVDTTFGGYIRAESFFTCMYGSSTTFHNVISPRKLDLDDYADSEQVPIPKAGTCVLENDKHQQIRISHSMFEFEESRDGGAHIWNVIDLYRKFYYAPVDRGEKIIESITSTTDFIFI